MGATGSDREGSTTPALDGSHGGRDARWADPSRATGFSDAVFAIIITLLVLELPPPKGEPGHMLSDLLAQWPAYLAYVASYLTVGVVWTNHRAAFHHIRRMDWGLYWVNLGVLFATGLLPFPTVMVARAIGEGNLADQRTAVALYTVIGMLVTLSWVLFFHYLSRRPQLLAHDGDHAFFASERRRGVYGAITYVGAGLLGALLAPKLGLAFFVLAPIFYALTSEGSSGWPGMRRGT